MLPLPSPATQPAFLATGTPHPHATQPPTAHHLASLKRQSLTAHLLFQDRRPSYPHSSLIESVVAAFQDSAILGNIWLTSNFRSLSDILNTACRK